MKSKLENDLLAIGIVTLLLILIIAVFPSTVLRIILGLPFVLFFPGYTLVAALFPRTGRLDGIERTALSFGLSIVVVPLVGLVLNYTPWGVRLYPILVSLAIFIIAMSAVAWWRRWQLPVDDRFGVSFKISLPQWGTQSSTDKVLSIFLVVAILGTIGTLGYVVASPKMGERFTEFYVLGLEGKTEGYPSDLSVGETGKVILGIVNRERAEMTYGAKLTIDGDAVKVWLSEAELDELGPITLASGGKWEQEIGFVAQKAGNDQKVEFSLYREGETEPYQTLHIWIDVS